MKRIKGVDRKIRLLLAAIIVCGGVCIAAVLNYVDVRGGTLDDMEWRQKETGGYEIECFRLGMKKGGYTLNVSYDTGEELSYRVVDMQRDNGKNELGKEITSGLFPSEGSDVTVDLELSENVGGLALYLESDNNTAGTGSWELITRSGAFQDFFLLFLCMTAGLLFLYRFRDWKRYSGVMIAVATALMLTLPYLTGYQQNGDDLDFHLARIRGIAGALSSGQLPVRLNTDFAWGYGFSSSMMYPELFMYIPAILYLLGVSLIASYKFLVLCMNIATACVGLYSFRRLLRSDSLGLVVTLLYLTNPYRLENIFHRAALGEMLAQIFLPLLLYGIYELIFGNAKRWWVSVLAATGILQSHILSVEMSLIFVVGSLIAGAAYIVRNGWKDRLIGMVKTAVFAIVINLWFIVPFLDHFGDDNLIQTDVRNLQETSVDLYTLFRVNMKLQGAYESAGVTREEFISIGVVVLIGSLIYIYYAFVRKTIDVRIKKIGTVCLCIGGLCCYMSIRAFPWGLIQNMFPMLYKVLGTIQFSWRFLAYASLFLSVTTGIAIMELIRDKRKETVAVLVGLAVFMTFSCMDQYASKEIFVSSRSEVKSRQGTWFDYYAADVNAEEILEQGDTIKTDSDIEISGYERNGVELFFDYCGVTDECTLRLPIYDYGMYDIYLNGEKVDAAPAENHQLTLKVTEDEPEGHIEVRYHEPVLYKVSDLTSIAGGIVLMGMWVRKRRRER